MIRQLDLFIRIEPFRLACTCKSHNGFITQRGQEMQAASVARGLTEPPHGVILDDSSSVSGPTPDARPGSIDQKMDPPDPPSEFLRS